MDRQFVTFKLGEDTFGIDILLVREINRNLAITQVNRCPDFVQGLLNLRSQIVTVLNLAVRLGLPEREIQHTSSCVVIKTAAEGERNPLLASYVGKLSPELVGLLVDEIGDVVSVDTEDIEPPTIHASGVASAFIEGVAKLEKKLLVILNVGEIVTLKRQTAA